MNKSARRILVLGGTGFVGRAVCEVLVREHADAQGLAQDMPLHITVPTRRRRHGTALQMMAPVDLLQADVHDERALAQLVAGSDAVVNLIAILHGSPAAFEKVHVELPRRLMKACHDAGVKRVVHISALGVGGDAPSAYLRSKTQGEAVLKTVAGVSATVLRPSVIFGANDRFLNMFAKLQAFAPLMPLASSGARFQPVWVEDVAQAVVRVLNRPETAGHTYECAGPEVLTLSELVQLAGRSAGCERPQIPLPDALGRLQALVMEMLPGEPLMSRDNLKSMLRPNVASGKLPGLADLGIQAASVRAIAPQYLGPNAGRGRFDHWRGEVRGG